MCPLKDFDESTTELRKGTAETDLDKVEETSMLGVKRSEYSPIGVILPLNIIDQDH